MNLSTALSGDTSTASDTIVSPPFWATRSGAETYVINLAVATASLAKDQHATVVAMARLGITSNGAWQDGQLSSALPITANGPSAWSLWQTLLHATTADIWVSPVKKPAIKLLLCDMDSTLITTESLDELAAHTGIGEKVAAITSRAMNGELDFIEALHERVELLKGLDYSAVEECVLKTQYSNGARELIAHARQNGVRAVLVSGGFTPFAEHVSQTLGFDEAIANQLEIENHKLTGRVLDPIVTKDTKLDVLRDECAKLDINSEQCCTIGDGANDIPMLQAAGFGVAYRAKNVVLRSTPHHLTQASLDVLSEWLNWGE
ncbi:MAG: phosphoserine phosphatase SerB [Gammaproteobacteria bacterium]